MTTTNTHGPTPKQVRYLRVLSSRTGQTFACPHTRRDASREIRRLQDVADNGFSFAELEAEQNAREANSDIPLYSPAVTHGEVAGHGSSATWRQRS